MTGCLRPAPSSSDAAATTGAAGTPGAAGTAGAAAGTPGAAATTGNVADQKFLLTDAAAADASAAPSPADPASAGTARVSYRLIANPTALAPHVGKKLELTGTLEDPNASTQDSTAGANATLPALRVASGKIVGESCDSK